jgi:hypothetical protein
LAALPDGVHIIVMAPHAIIIGMPMFIIVIIRWQHSMNMSFMASSIGIISHFMPVGVMVQVILHIIIAIGIMPPIIGIMPPIISIMPPIDIGIIVCIGIMPPMMGIFIGIMVDIGIPAFIVWLQTVSQILTPVGGSPSAAHLRARGLASNEKIDTSNGLVR